MDELKVKLVVPTGRLNESVVSLLADAGLRITMPASGYRPPVSDARFEVKLLKAANVPRLVELGAHDIGFCGLDWIRETGADVVTLLDTGMQPVRIVAAAPVGSNPFAPGRGRPVMAASEYENLTRGYMSSKGVEWQYVRTWGATEVFPPEDADLIVDNTATGAALAANGLEILDEVMRSTTLLVANRRVMDDPARAAVIEELRVLIQSVLDARRRVLLDMNVSKDRLDAVVRILPAMKSPTIQALYGDDSFAVRAAVPKDQVAALIPKLRKAGATDILQTAIQRVIV